VLLLGSPRGWAATPPIVATPAGIDLKIGDANIELAAATPTAFRLSISYEGKAGALPTSFLASPAAATMPKWKMTGEKGRVGLKTPAGELVIDPATGQWTLHDPKGATLIPVSRLGMLSSTDSLAVPIAWNKTTPFQFYGCGNAVASLEQSAIQSRLGNGVAIIPHYWSRDGYAVLAVSEQDNQPATAAQSADKSALVWHFPGKRADLYLMPAATLADAARAYDQLTGTPPVPPEWAFGYLQSRWGWRDRAYIEDTLRQFLARKIPVDAFIYDFEWYTPQPDYALPPQGAPNFPDFGWNPKTFPDPKAQVDAYRAQGLRFVGIRKPRLGNSASLKEMRAKGWLLGEKGNDKSIFHSRDMDFFVPGFRDWYAEQSQQPLEQNIYGWWNDEGESSFTTYYYWNMAELKAYAQAKPNRRLWTLNRAFSPGLQREGAACWTGDIQANWKIFSETPAALLNWSLAGMTYGACDIGGYSPETNAHLLARWMEAGVFFPVYRCHSEIGRTPHFPWLFGPDAENAIHKSINLRYRLIPYYYSLAHEAFETGVPLMRPLAMEFPHDPQAANLSSQWLMGPALMAAPILSDSNERAVYLPEGDWFKFGTNARSAGGQTMDVSANLDEIPVFVRAGTILPLGPVVQNTDHLPGGPLEVQVYPGRDARFTLVEDDGLSNDYLKGAVRRTTFRWDDARHRLSWKTEGSYSGPHLFHELKVVVFDAGNGMSADLGTEELDKGGEVSAPGVN
jgi:alpha-glucosidase